MRPDLVHAAIASLRLDYCCPLPFKSTTGTVNILVQVSKQLLCCVPTAERHVASSQGGCSITDTSPSDYWSGMSS